MLTSKKDRKRFTDYANASLAAGEACIALSVAVEAFQHCQSEANRDKCQAAADRCNASGKVLSLITKGVDPREWLKEDPDA